MCARMYARVQVTHFTSEGQHSVPTKSRGKSRRATGRPTAQPTTPLCWAPIGGDLKEVAGPPSGPEGGRARNHEPATRGEPRGRCSHAQHDNQRSEGESHCGRGNSAPTLRAQGDIVIVGNAQAIEGGKSARSPRTHEVGPRGKYQKVPADRCEDARSRSRARQGVSADVC